MVLLTNIFSKKNYRIAFGIVLLLSAWLLTGVLSGAQQADQSSDQSPAANKPASLVSVRAKYIVAEPVQTRMRVSGRSEASRIVKVRAEVDGQVVATPIAKGSLVKAGDILCELAVEDRELRVAEALAAVDKTQLEYRGALRLKTGGYQSETAIASAKAALDTAKADLKRRQLDLDKLAIRAPFDGVVDDRVAELGDLMRRGDECATVLDLNPILLTAQLSALEAASVKQGSVATAKLLTGATVSGIVRYIGRQTDDLTRTFPLEVAVENPDYALSGGISADIQLPTGEAKAQLISPSLIALDDRGDIGVRILDENNTVLFVNIRIVADAGEKVWVTGLPEKTVLITVGQEYVSAGQQVAVTFEDDDKVGAVNR